MFEVKEGENVAARLPDTLPNNQNIVLIGCSLPLNRLFLGDTNTQIGCHDVDEPWG